MAMLSLLWLVPLGWAAGAAVNYLSDVLPAVRKLTGLSCTQCGRSVTWQEVLLLRPCPDCGQKASVRTWVVQLAGPVLTVLIWFYPPQTMGFTGGLLWLTYFGLVAVIDLEHKLILHPVSLVGAVLGVISGTLYHGVLSTLLGGAVGFGVMFGLYLLGGLFIKLVSRLRGEEVDDIALGFGDVNLAGILGLVLGWPGVIAGLVLGILIGGAGSALYLLYRTLTGGYQAYEALPYGPFLILSAVYLFYLAPYLH
jgi:leader peptidase (prepilin peptidase)/N-methyltransferase